MQTIRNYIDAARILLQDTQVGAYRYSDDEFKLALSLAFDEAYRLRPDMFIQNTIPDLVAADTETTDVPAPRGYQSAFLYYMTGHVQLRDEEETTDARASVFLNKFVAQLMTTAA